MEKERVTKVVNERKLSECYAEAIKDIEYYKKQIKSLQEERKLLFLSMELQELDNRVAEIERTILNEVTNVSLREKVKFQLSRNLGLKPIFFENELNCMLHRLREIEKLKPKKDSRFSKKIRELEKLKRQIKRAKGEKSKLGSEGVEKK